MSETTPAQELREAAKTMRERAEKATQGIPWQAEERSSSAADAVINRGGRDVADCAIEDAEHIASWHPGVALAVADWLDRFDNELYCYGPAEFNHALAIARAYLGTKESTDA